jgi:NDP-sugar pyrophosphorylase family protein
MPGMDQFSFELEVYPKLIKNRLMKAYITNRRFYDIGTPERLKTIEEIL